MCKHRFCNVRWCIANHFLCSCVCDMDHESAIKYHYYYRALESIWLGSSWKALGKHRKSILWCWRPSVTGRQVNVFLLTVGVRVGGVKLQPFTVMLDSDKGVYRHPRVFLRFRFGDRKEILRDRLEEFERPFSIDVISGHYILRDRWRNLRDRFGSSKHLKKNTGCVHPL